MHLNRHSIQQIHNETIIPLTKYLQIDRHFKKRI